MSYDLEFGVKVDTGGDGDLFVAIATPDLDNPTCNYGKIFRASTGWDFEQGKWYRYIDVEPLILRGIEELTVNAKKYRPLEPANGYGTVGGALRVLRGLVEDARGHADEDGYVRYPYVPIEHIYVSW